MVISYSELDDILLSLTTLQPNYPLLYRDILLNYYNTGIRPSELFLTSNWSYLGPGNIILQPLKGNNIRTFNITDLTPYFVNKIQSGKIPYSPINSERIKQYFKKFIKIYPLYVGDKQQEVNLYRHRYIKGLKLSGLTNNEITVKLGYTNSNTLLNYLDSVITTK